MQQVWEKTVWNGLSVTSATANYSDAVNLAGIDYLKLWVVLTIQSFTSVIVSADSLAPNGSWYPQYDAAGVLVYQSFGTDFTGAVTWGPQSELGVGRAAESATCGLNLRFKQTVTGTSGTPGTLYLKVTAYRQAGGKLQTR